MPPRPLFDPIAPPERQHPNFVRLATDPGAEPTRLMMEEVFASMGTVDRNFVQQFQTTGFDARVFELFLHAYFASTGADLGRVRERPDFLLTRGEVTVAVEATTANPTQTPGATPAPITGVDLEAFAAEPEDERRARLDHELPVRLGSALFSKLGKEYWKLPHVCGRPLVFAVQPFHAHDALLFSSAALAQYLYGLRQTGHHDEDGRLVIDTQPVAEHQLGDRPIPSNFFAQPGAEHVSAVLYANVGSVSKFTRMGYQAGLHRGNVIVTRVGAAWDPDPDAAEAAPFAYRLDEDPGDEPWGSGVEVFHNPRALHPVPADFFPDAVQTRLEDGVPVSWSPPFVPYHSITHRQRLAYDSLTPVGAGRDVGTILRREFDARELVRPPYGAGEVPFSEVAWFADEGRRVVGAVLRWHGEEQYGVVVLGPGTDGVWRAVDVQGDYESLDAAAQAITRRIRQLAASA